MNNPYIGLVRFQSFHPRPRLLRSNMTVRHPRRHRRPASSERRRAVQPESYRGTGCDHRRRNCGSGREGPIVISALQRFEMGQERPPNVYYAFDLLWLNGKDLQNLPIEDRKAKLEGLLKKPPGVIRYSVSFRENAEALLSRARELGLEGLIGKRLGSRNRPR